MANNSEIVVKPKRTASVTKNNRAFADALVRARAYAKDPKALRELFQEAVRKTRSIPKAPFKDLWGYFQAMVRLIRA